VRILEAFEHAHLQGLLPPGASFIGPHGNRHAKVDILRKT